MSELKLFRIVTVKGGDLLFSSDVKYCFAYSESDAILMYDEDDTEYTDISRYCEEIPIARGFLKTKGLFE